MNKRRLKTLPAIAGVALVAMSAAALAPVQDPDGAAVIRQVDAAVAARVSSVVGFTDIEHYAVYRGDDDKHPVAEMTVRDTYEKYVGKTYTILSESGSRAVLRFGLKPIIDGEKTINLPGNVEKSWFDSANYEMKLKPGGAERMNGRDCYVLDVTPRRKATNMIDGTMWVDARSGAIVQIEGIASRRPSVFAGPTHMMRQYMQVNGFPMATHARAESNSMFFGRIVVAIDYSDYHLQLRDSK